MPWISVSLMVTVEPSGHFGSFQEVFHCTSNCKNPEPFKVCGAISPMPSKPHHGNGFWARRVEIFYV